MINDDQNATPLNGITEDPVFVSFNQPTPPDQIKESISLIGTSTGTDIQFDGRVNTLEGDFGAKGLGGGSIPAIIPVTYVSTFNNRSGNVTFTSTDLPNVGIPGTYGDSTNFPIVTVDAYGRITAISTTDLSETQILRLPVGPPYGHVNHGKFWPQDSSKPSLGSGFWWDAWVKPLSTVTGYLVSAGYGGEHELLWGFTGQAQTGNVYNGTATVSFGGSYLVAAGEWVYVAVVWDGTRICTFVNGVCDSGIALLGARTATPGNGGAAILFVGGSDHLNLPCDLAMVRGWDAALPTTPARAVFAGFRPDRFMALWDSNNLPCDFACDYTVPHLPQDVSPGGYPSLFGSTVKYRHPGRIYEANAGSYFGPPDAFSPTFVPAWVADSTCPFKQPLGSVLPAETIPTPGAVPGAALAFDSFGRRNQTWAFQAAPSLGSTEGGSLGPLAWQNGAPVAWTADRIAWGILGGAAVLLGDAPAVAWVAVGTANQDVRVSRSTALTGFGRVGLAFRVQDASNYWWAYNAGSSTGTGAGTIFIGRWVAGANTDVTSFAGSGAWTTLRVVASGTTITFYTDATQIGQLTGQTVLQSATGAGLGTYKSTSTESLDRYRNFTVLAG